VAGLGGLGFVAFGGDAVLGRLPRDDRLAEHGHRIGHFADLVAATGEGHGPVVVAGRQAAHEAGHGLDRLDDATAHQRDPAPDHQQHQHARPGQQGEGQLGLARGARLDRGGVVIGHDHDLVDHGAMGLVGDVGPGQALAGALQVAGTNGGQDLLVDLAPERHGRRGRLVDQHRAHGRIDRRGLPIGVAGVVVLAQGRQLVGGGVHGLGMGDQLGGHQVGLDHIERRGQDVGDDVLVVDDLAEQRTADPQALDREQSHPAGQDQAAASAPPNVRMTPEIFISTPPPNS
jgi:hypothetical protein